MKSVAAALEPRGVREREFMASITRMRTEHAWEPMLKVHTSSDSDKKSDMKILDTVEYTVPEPDDPESWNRDSALRIDLGALAAVESLEEKVASASMQLKVMSIF